MSIETKKSNGAESGEASRKVGKKRKAVENGKSDKNDVVVAPIDDSDDKSAYARVTETLRTFNRHYLHFVQVDFSPAVFIL